MEEWRVYLCEDSLDGIFTAVYNAYEDGGDHKRNKIQFFSDACSRQLFTEYREVKTDFEKAEKVARTLRRKGCGTVYEELHRAAVSCYPDRGDVIYHVIQMALAMGDSVLDYLTNCYVVRLMELVRYTNNEIQRELQFLRFEELRNGTLFARINPKNAVLPFLADHFSDRFSGENWVIADSEHREVLFHKKGQGCSLVGMQDVDFDALSLEFSGDEKEWQRLWKRFVDSVAIEARKNSDLQRQMLPLRYRKYMREFAKPTN